MSIFEQYFLLFTDTFISNLVINSSFQELVLNAMLIFATYNIDLLFTISCLAFGCANLVNYFFGVVLCNILKIESKIFTKNINTCNAFILKYPKVCYFGLSILAVIPFVGKFGMLFSGLVRMKLKYIIPLSMLLKLLTLFFV